jgi:hypothetical protein
MGFLESLGKTLKSLGGVVAAPAGLAYDLASMVSDDKDDDFGSVLAAAAHRGGDVLDPFTNSGTWTGYGFGKTMAGLSTVYKQAVDRPLGTVLLEGQHATSGDFGGIFSGEDWAKAYSLSKNQTLGQSAIVGLADSPSLLTSVDPFEKGKTFADSGFTKDHPFLAGAGALGIDLATTWYLDPAVLAGKGASAARMKSLGRLRNSDRADIAARMDSTTAATGVSSQDWAGRFDRYFDYVAGDNHFQRPLNAAEIHAASPELQRSAQGKAIAGLMDDAMKLPEPLERKNALRRVLAVSAGDPSQIARLKQESAGAQAIADGLTNVAQSTTARLHLQALKDVRLDPEFNAEFSRQLDNLNAEGAVDGFVKEWSARTQARLDANVRMLDVQGDLNFLPGKHGITGDHALKVQNKESIGAKVSQAHDDTIKWAKDLASRESYTSVFQKSLYHMPLVVAHPVGLLASPYTKGLHAAVGAVRTTRFNGVANLHDWNGSTAQLDTMMKIAGVEDPTRLKYLSDAYKASSEADKLTAIHRVERVATAALATKMSERVGRTIDPSFIQEITSRGQMARSASTARSDGGRIYAATEMPEGMAARTRGYAEAKAQRTAALKGTDPGEITPTWHVDQIPDESGLPMSFPMTVAQLGNRVPLFDIDLASRLTKDAAWTDRFSKLSDAWTVEARDLNRLEAAFKRSGAKSASLLGKAVDSKRTALDALTNAGSMMTRWWKYSVLFRLGYPMRVLMDDHMRIASQMHWSSFALGSMREGVGNGIYNNAPAMIYGGGRRAAARQAFTAARARRSELVTHLGRDAHTDLEWTQLQAATKAYYHGPSEGWSEARAKLDKLDPDGRVSEHLATVHDARSLGSSIRGHKKAVAQWKAQLEIPGADTATLHQKIQAAEADILDKEAGRAHLLDQLGDDPNLLRKELARLNKAIDSGVKGFAGDRHHLGMSPVKLDDNLLATGVYGPGGAMYREEAGSKESFNQLVTDGEEASMNLMSSGAHRTIHPTEPGHTHVWANVLNHQFINSPELMAFVRGKVSNPREFAKWVGEPEQAYLRNRVRHFAADPEDWGSRLQELYHDYVPTTALRDALREGPVSARRLNKLFPDVETRPVVHGQLANVNSGRHTATRILSAGFNRMFKLLSEVPTDNLSRHPFMSAIYKQELRDGYAVKKAFYAREGKEFTPDDLRELERTARIKALGHLKRTLWDVSAHSQGAHTMRFLSPFFAAHQEALTRWWRIATDDPSIVRKFQLGFDAPRKAGLTYDAQTGELVPEGEGPSPSHQIMLRVPFAKDSSAVNKWIKGLGGGKYWHVNENGFNLILQNGIANPGVGPVVTVPMEALVNRYANQPDIEKMARILNPYPPDSPGQAVMPAWSKRLQALIQGPGNREWGNRYNANLADSVIQWRNDHGEQIPTESQFDALTQRAADDTNRDLGLMLLSNVTSPLPAKPESKYAVVQHGISKIMSTMRTGGHDYTWARDQVRAKYGDIYTALLYSQSNNKAHLSNTYAEVGAMKRYRGVLNKTDPTLARMVVGPAAAMDAEADPHLGLYSPAARRFMMNEKVNPYSTETYTSSKEPDEAAVASLIDAGWTQYGELTNWLTVQAENQGLTSYEDNPQLVKAKQAGIKYLLETNFAFASDWNAWDHGAGYEAKLADMRQIASDKSLAQDPTRTDIYWLGQYLTLRDTITAAMAERKAAGGAGSAEAKSNADLVRVFSAGLQYIRHQNTYFDQFHFHGIIERDPLLLAAPDEEN